MRLVYGLAFGVIFWPKFVTDLWILMIGCIRTKSLSFVVTNNQTSLLDQWIIESEKGVNGVEEIESSLTNAYQCLPMTSAKSVLFSVLDATKAKALQNFFECFCLHFNSEFLCIGYGLRLLTIVCDDCEHKTFQLRVTRKLQTNLCLKQFTTTNPSLVYWKFGRKLPIETRMQILGLNI